MKVSFNEIEMTIEKALYGGGYSVACARSAARSASMLQALGFNAVDMLIPLMETVQQPHARIVSESEERVVIDCKHISCAIGGNVWAVNLLENGLNGLSTELINAYDAPFLIPFLQGNGLDGVCLQWVCRGVQKSVYFSAEQSYFDLRETDSFEKHSNLILCYFDAGGDRKKTLSNENFTKRYQKALETGIAVEGDKWQRLCHFAKRMLVSESQRSLQDAGESAELVDVEDVLIKP